MKVLMVSLDFPPTVGGIAAHVYELSKKLQQFGVNVTVLTRRNKGEKKEEVIDGIFVYRIELRFLGITYGLQINQAIQKLIKKIEPNILHIHGMRPLEFLKKNSIPVVYTNHTSGYLKRIKKGGYRVALLKRLFQKPDLILAPSKELLDIPFFVRAKKYYIPNGVDVQKYRKDNKVRTSLRKKFNFKEDDIVGIVTRRLVKKNGVLYLAKATKFLKNTNVKLVIIGDGEEYENIKKELQKNFSKRFIMLGAKTHQEIKEFYSMADFSILPSLMEATSISGLEAMAASLPLIGTKVGGIPELIDEGKNGFLCEPANEYDLAQKIDLLLEQNLEKFGKYSFDKVKNEFDWSIIAQKTLEVYKSIV